MALPATEPRDIAKRDAREFELQEQNNLILRGIKKSVDSITDMFFKQQEKDKFQDQEDKRENDRKPQVVPNKKDKGGFSLPDFGDISGFALSRGLLAAVAILATDMEDAARVPQALKVTGEAFKSIARLTYSIEETIVGLSKPITTAAKMIKDTSVGITMFLVRPLVSLVKSVKVLEVTTKGLASTAHGVVKGISGVATTLTKAVGFLSNISGVTRLLGIAKNFGKWVFGPITITLLSVVDFVQGFMRGFEQGGILEGVKQGLWEVFTGLVTEPLDLIKDIVSWASKKLGLENFSHILDNFSFTSLASSISDKMVEALGMATEWVKGAIVDPTQALSNLTDMSISALFDFGAYMFNNVLKPTRDWILGNIVSPYVSFQMTGLDIIFNPGKYISEYVLRPMANWLNEKTGFDLTPMIEPVDAIMSIPTKIVSNLLNPIKDMILNGIPTQAELKSFFKDFDLSSMFSTIVDALKLSIKNMIASVLPAPDSLLGNLLPDWIYEKYALPVARREQRDEATARVDAAFSSPEPIVDRTVKETNRILHERAIKEYHTRNVIVNNVDNSVNNTSTGGGGRSRSGGGGNVGVSTEPPVPSRWSSQD